ncbi:MAG: very short patch repair endonuclease [Mucilaginibacter sp.]
MADIHTKEARSYNMSRIRAKDTKPELLVRKFLFSKGFRYRLHDNKLPGTPDIILPKYKTIIFINGCFWHGHENCSYATIPETRTEWWDTKIRKTVYRDEAAQNELKSDGWQVILIWGCELMKKTKLERLERLLDQIVENLS